MPFDILICSSPLGFFELFDLELDDSECFGFVVDCLDGVFPFFSSSSSSMSSSLDGVGVETFFLDEAGIGWGCLEGIIRSIGTVFGINLGPSLDFAEIGVNSDPAVN